MSTTVDNKSRRRGRISSEAMRERVLAAAAKAFSRAGYDAVGVREIAAMADTDPAIVMRLFGSKAGLFEALADHAFGADEIFEGPLETLGKRLASHLMLPIFPVTDTDEIDDFHLLLRSATSLTAAPILSAALHRALIDPLALRIDGKDARVRAALITAQVLGFATLRFALGSPPIEASDQQATTDHLARLIQLCVEG